METIFSASDRILVGESDPDFALKASPQEKRAVAIATRTKDQTEEQRQKIYAEVGVKTTIRAKYKIEVKFSEASRTRLGPNLVGIQVWESGKRLSGAGDEAAFFCLSKLTNEGCGNVITQDHIKGGVAWCPICKKGVNANLLTEVIVARPSTRNLAKKVLKLFRSLGSNADIYVKFHKQDMLMARIRSMPVQSADEKKKNLELSIYPLQNILNDTAHGADLEGQFFALLTS